jgi:hypothetical protein
LFFINSVPNTKNKTLGPLTGQKEVTMQYRAEAQQLTQTAIVTVERTTLTHVLPAQANWSKSSIHSDKLSVRYTHFADERYGRYIGHQGECLLHAFQLTEPMAIIRISVKPEGGSPNDLAEALEIGPPRTAKAWVVELCPEYQGFPIEESEIVPVTKEAAEAQ